MSYKVVLYVEHLEYSEDSQCEIKRSCLRPLAHHVTRGLRKTKDMIRTCKLVLITALACAINATTDQTFSTSKIIGEAIILLAIFL